MTGLIRGWLLVILLAFFAASTGKAQEQAKAQTQLPFTSLLKLRVHAQVEEIRQNQNEIVDYLMETHVRKIQMDYYVALQKKGLTIQEIDTLFKAPPYQKLFKRVRQNKVLHKRAQDFVAGLTQPYFLEEKVIEAFIALSDQTKNKQKDVYQQAVLDMQKNIRQIKTQTIEGPSTLIAKIKHTIITFFTSSS